MVDKEIIISNNTKSLMPTDYAYLAGFLDGDGSIIAQLVKGDYKYKFTVRISVYLYQKKDKHWFFIQLQKKLGYGNIRDRKDGMLEFGVTGAYLSRKFLTPLLPYLIVKKRIAVLVFNIIEANESVKNVDDFLKVCKLVDEIATHTYSKKRKNTSSIVKEILGLPVETAKF